MLTDNKNRAVSEIRHAFSKNGGNLGAEGAVSWMFTKKGVIVVDKDAADEDKLTEIVLEAGAEDLNDEGENWEILCDPKDFEAVTDALKAAKIKTGARRGDHDRQHLHQARRRAGERDDAAARDDRRPGRHAECLLATSTSTKPQMAG